MSRVVDLEARDRRNNIRIVGLPEAIEGPRPIAVFSKILHQVLDEQILSTLPELECAY